MENTHHMRMKIESFGVHTFEKIQYTVKEEENREWKGRERREVEDDCINQQNQQMNYKLSE